MIKYLTSKIGLGDLAYYAFRPVVYAVDFVWGTDLKDCSVCKARRSKWNKLGALPLWILLVTLVAVVTIWRLW